MADPGTPQIAWDDEAQPQSTSSPQVTWDSPAPPVTATAPAAAVTTPDQQNWKQTFRNNFGRDPSAQEEAQAALRTIPRPKVPGLDAPAAPAAPPPVASPAPTAPFTTNPRTGQRTPITSTVVPPSIGAAVSALGAPVRSGAEAIKGLIKSEAADTTPFADVRVPSLRRGGPATTIPGASVQSAYKNVIAPAGEQAASFLGGMADPVNMALMGGLSAIPATTNAARALHAATRAYLAGTMGIGGVKQAYEAYQAAEGGNVPEAVRKGFGSAFDLAFAGGMVLGPGKGYTPLPDEPQARATELFRNLIYKAGGNLPGRFTPEQASAEFRKAQTNLRDPQNPANDLDLSKDLSAAYADYNQHARSVRTATTPADTSQTQARSAQAEQAVNTILPSLAGTPEAKAAAAAAVSPAPAIAPEAPAEAPAKPAKPVKTVNTAKTVKPEAPAEASTAPPPQVRGPVLPQPPQLAPVADADTSSSPERGAAIQSPPSKETTAPILSTAPPTTVPTGSSPPAAGLAGESGPTKATPETKYKFGSTQANIPETSEAHGAIEAARQRISDSDLAGDGKEIGSGGNHVTVRYGIQGEDTAKVRAFLEQQAPFEASLGKTDSFPPSEHSDGAAVIVAPIEAPELHRIHAEIEKHGDFKQDSFPEYKPHATIAYVKPGKAGRYTGMSVTSGKKFTVDHIAITDRQGNQDEVQLKGTAEAAPADVAWDQPAAKETRTLAQKKFDEAQPAKIPAPGKTGDVPTSSLTLAPQKFQYKLGTDAEGTSSLLKEQTRYNPDLAGVITVWRDPADGKTYVVNGHHRYELARRTNAPNVAVRHIAAANATRARVIGALQNIAEGRGTPVDAAKFMRDSGLTLDEMKAEGVSLGEATAAKGYALSRLDDGLFNQVVQGELPVERAVAIGEATPDHAEQKAIADLIDAREAKGKHVTNDTLRELVGFVKGTAKTTETSASLFGEEQVTRSLALEKAEVSAYIKQQLSKDRRFFGVVSKTENAARLEKAEAGKVNVGKSKQISDSARQAEEVYDRLKNYAGPVSDALESAAERLSRGEQPNVVKQAAYDAIRAAVSQTLAGRQEGSTAGSKETAGRGNQPAQQDLVDQPLFHPEQWRTEALKPETVASASAFREPREGKVPSRLAMNHEARLVISSVLGKMIRGAVMSPSFARKAVTRLHKIADIYRRVPIEHYNRAVAALDALASHIEEMARENGPQGVPVVLVHGEYSDVMHTLNEELFHAMAQVGPGGGDFHQAVPAELIDDPVVKAMRPSIEREHGISDPVHIVAEAMVDVWTGEYEKFGISDQEAIRFTKDYFRLAPPEAVEGARNLLDYMGRRLEGSDRLLAEAFHAGASQRAISQGSTGPLHPERTAGDGGRVERNKGGGGKRGNNGDSGPLSRNAAEGVDREAPDATNPQLVERGQPDERPSGNKRRAVAEANQPARSGSGEVPGRVAAPEVAPRPGQAIRGTETATGKENNLARPFGQGLDDRELEAWIRGAKSLTAEPAGEQNNLFGEPEKVYQLTRTDSQGNTERYLVGQSQYDQLSSFKPFQKALAAGQQSALFGKSDVAASEIIGSGKQGGIELPPQETDNQGTLFRPGKASARDLATGESGTAVVPPAVSTFLADTYSKIERSRDLEQGIFNLQKQQEADQLRAIQLMKDAGGKPDDWEALYHYVENPAEELSEPQQALYDQYIAPIRAENEQIYREIRENAEPDPNHIHRVVEDSGSWLDRMLSGRSKTGKSNVLSKSAASLKGRTMMALETDDGRRVVAVRGLQAIDVETGDSHGTIEQDEDGTRTVNGMPLVQATTKEIEASTSLRYYHNALASEISENLELKRAYRAMQFIADLKARDDFGEMAIKDTGRMNVPKGYARTLVPQLTGYFFEKPTAEVLDRFQHDLQGGDMSALERMGNFLTTSIFLNPLLHVPNITVHWAVEKGKGAIGGVAQSALTSSGRQAAVKALNAVVHRNADFLEALDHGAPLQSHRPELQQMQKLLFETLGREMNLTGWEKAGKALGYANPGQWVKAWYKLSSKVTWVTNDVAFMQAVYEKQARGMGLDDAISETAKHIPDYRIPTRVLDSPMLSKMMRSRLISMFMAYHYGALKSYGEAMKSAFGVNQRPTGGEAGRGKDVAHGWDILAAIAFVTFALYPAYDEVVRRLSGDKNARMRRAGAATFPYNLYLMGKHERSASDVAQSVFTPSVIGKKGAELFFNRDLRTGRMIYNPTANFGTQAQQAARHTATALSPVDQGLRAWDQPEGAKKTLWQMAGVSFPKSGAEKIAQEIAMGKPGSMPQTDAERRRHLSRREAIEQGRKGNWGPLREAVNNGDIDRSEMGKIQREAHMDPLLATVDAFTYSEAMQVYQAATPEQKDKLRRIILRKRHNLLMKHRGKEVEEVEANQ